MHVILLDVEYEFARFPFASETPAFMLPVVGRTLLDRTVDWVQAFRPRRISLVTKRDLDAFPEARDALERHDIRVIADFMDMLRTSTHPVEPMVVLQANLHPLPNASRIRAQHKATGGGVLSHARGTIKTAPGVYTYGPPVLLIASPRAAGVIAGRLVDEPFRRIPRILRDHGVISTPLDLDRPLVEINCNFALYDANLGDLAEYRYELYGQGLRPVRPNLWAADGVDIGDVQFDPRGGLVVVGAGTRLEGRTALRGPAIIGERVVVGAGSCIHRGLVLDGAALPPESFVARGVVSRLIHEQVPS